MLVSTVYGNNDILSNLDNINEKLPKYKMKTYNYTVKCVKIRNLDIG